VSGGGEWCSFGLESSRRRRQRSVGSLSGKQMWLRNIVVGTVLVCSHIDSRELRLFVPVIKSLDSWFIHLRADR
jgi:hypothetical protein